MSRRVLAVMALVLASTLFACAESVTAPPQPTLAPPAPQLQGGSCKGGYILSDGRCG